MSPRSPNSPHSPRPSGGSDYLHCGRLVLQGSRFVSAMMEPGKMRCGYVKASPSVRGNEVALDGENGKRYVETTVSVGSAFGGRFVISMADEA